MAPNAGETGNYEDRQQLQLGHVSHQAISSKLRLRSSEAKNTGKTTEPIREFQTVPHRVVKVDSEHISTAHIEWPKGNQVRAVDVAGAISSSWM